MVASGVASKGLDFNDIQHVIIFSMPKEIEDYVHQIGRTGRSGKTGIATTFVNMNTPEQTLLDLKYLLMEAGQKFVPSFFLIVVYIEIFRRVPPFLLSIDDPRAAQGASLTGCPVCGGKYILYTAMSNIIFISTQVSVTESRTVRSSKMPNGGKWPHIVGRTIWAVTDIVLVHTCLRRFSSTIPSVVLCSVCESKVPRRRTRVGSGVSVSKLRAKLSRHRGERRLMKVTRGYH